MRERRVETVRDPALGVIRQVFDGEELVAEATMSPVYQDGTVMYFDESHVFYAGGGLLPTPAELLLDLD